jgi:hypothetical protein
MKKDASTQVNFEPQIYEAIIIDLRQKNRKLEELSYNTRYNSGRSDLSDHIHSVSEKDELISLRQEFKNMVVINQNLTKSLRSINIPHSMDDTKRDHCCCCVLS